MFSFISWPIFEPSDGDGELIKTAVNQKTQRMKYFISGSCNA